MRMKEIYMLAEELCVQMSYGEITMDDAVDTIRSEYSVLSSSIAYDILEDIMRSECEA